jgi:hypothetical protein
MPYNNDVNLPLFLLYIQSSQCELVNVACAGSEANLRVQVPAQVARPSCRTLHIKLHIQFPSEKDLICKRSYPWQRIVDESCAQLRRQVGIEPEFE